MSTEDGALDLADDGPGGEDAKAGAARLGYEFSAGGVVVDDGKVAVIVPTRRGTGGSKVLALPKGHPEPGESAWDAAAREVREEAGIIGDSLGSLGVVQYVYERGGRLRRKRVEFFLMHYTGGALEDHDHEVEQARWMPLSEAVSALTYAGERAIVSRAMRQLRVSP